MGADGGTSLLETPPYVIAIVFLFFLVVTLGFEWVTPTPVNLRMHAAISRARVLCDTSQKLMSADAADPAPHSARPQKARKAWLGGALHHDLCLNIGANLSKFNQHLLPHSGMITLQSYAPLTASPYQ